MPLRIEPQLQRHLVALSEAEETELRLNLLKSGGPIEPLVLWGETLLDGHHRYRLCQELDLPFETVNVNAETITVTDIESAKDWIDKNQIGRRNLSPADFKIISGRIYNRRKKQHGGKREASPQTEDLKTRDVVAQELGTSKATIERNAQRAEVHDAMLEAGDDEAAAAAKRAPQEVIAEASRQEPKEAANTVKNTPHVVNNSGENEWYTPLVYLDAAREVMGGIDTDPASSKIAQKNVKARKFYTAEQDGLAQPWQGRVWLNPPYAAGLVTRFCDKLIESLQAGEVTEAIVLTNNATETKWFDSLSRVASAACFPTGRIKYLDATGEPKNTPLQGQSFVYLGENPEGFAETFCMFGPCWRPVE